MKLLVEFEYDEKKLGKDWMNKFNLELCLFSEECTTKEYLKVKEIKDVIVEFDDYKLLRAVQVAMMKANEKGNDYPMSNELDDIVKAVKKADFIKFKRAK